MKQLDANPPVLFIARKCREHGIPAPPNDPKAWEFWGNQWEQACIDAGIFGKREVFGCETCRDTGVVITRDDRGYEFHQRCSHGGRLAEVDLDGLRFPPGIPLVSWRDLPKSLRDWRDWYCNDDAPCWLVRDDDHLPAHTFALRLAADALSANKRVRYINAAKCPGGKRSDPLEWAGPLNMDLLVIGQMDKRITGLKRIYVGEVLVSIPRKTRVLLLTKGESYGALEDELEARGARAV